MAEQIAKFIDVTRTFTPVDPNSFPESLHQAERDEAESRVPVMPYMGRNFLPTAYGYRSYFGTNQELGFDALTEQVDKVLMYQNASFANIMIALCDSGIWYKSGEAVGAWVNITPMSFVRGTTEHYDWTFAIIAQDLYVYRQNNTEYHKISGILTAPGISVTAVAPNFLNMEAQQGMFRAGGRLGFWDSANSVAWSNLDDYADFVPSLESLAGNVTFSYVQGRIVTILPHGGGFMIYASKSVVYVEEAPESLYQWKPHKVLNSSGIAYPRQAVVCEPDSIHFAYTPASLFKIEKSSAEVIVPEVTDALREARGPLYLNYLDNRYLFIEILDPGYEDGLAQFSVQDIPPVSYVLPGSYLEFPTVVTEDGSLTDIGYILDGINEGKYKEGQPPDNLKMTGTLYKPRWVAFLSNNGGNPGAITWVAAPCPTADLYGVEVKMCPGTAGLASNLTTNAANKRAVTGADAYIDGKWTMERFIGVQTAIWRAEEKALKAYIEEVTQRAFFQQKTTEGTGTPPAESDAPPSKCSLGVYVTQYSGTGFSYSNCSFGLSRIAEAAVEIKRVRKYKRAVQVGTPVWDAYIVFGSPHDTGSTAMAAATAAVQRQVDTGNTLKYAGYEGWALVSGPVVIGNNWSYTGTHYPVGHPESPSTYEQSGMVYLVTPYTSVETVSCYNEQVPFPDFPPTLETAYCELVGWDYTTPAGDPAFKPATTCMAEPSMRADPPKDPKESALPVDDDTGMINGKPFEGVVLDGITIEWPSETITIPGGDYLLQKGSIAPYYPTVYGALVYDLHLKKWGKYVGEYKQLLNYSPINTFTSAPVTYSRFGMLSGIVQIGGKLALFDPTPADSWLTWGKVGYYRRGITSAQEVKIQMRSISTGYLRVDTSLHGKSLSTGLTKTEQFTNTREATLYGAYPGKWQNITVGGIFDISYMEYRGFNNGKR